MNKNDLVYVSNIKLDEEGRKEEFFTVWWTLKNYNRDLTIYLQSRWRKFKESPWRKFWKNHHKENTNSLTIYQT